MDPRPVDPIEEDATPKLKVRCVLTVLPPEEEDAVPLRRRDIEQMLDDLRREMHERLGTQ